MVVEAVVVQLRLRESPGAGPVGDAGDKEGAEHRRGQAAEDVLLPPLPQHRRGDGGQHIAKIIVVSVNLVKQEEGQEVKEQQEREGQQQVAR